MSEKKEAEVLLVAPATEGQIAGPVCNRSAHFVKGAIVGAGLIGMAIFLRNSRLFARFNDALKIPQKFICNEVVLKGKVQEVLPAGILKVEHLPLLNLPKIFDFRNDQTSRLLNVRIAGLDVSDAGTTFLSKDLQLQNKHILFTVLKICGEKDYIIDADVTLRKKTFMYTDVNVELVRGGYARVLDLENLKHREALRAVPSYSRLVSRLLIFEKNTDNRVMSIWQRGTWIEPFAAYPSQISQIVKHSTATHILILIFSLTKQLIIALCHTAEQGYYAMVDLYQYLSQVSRLSATLINRSYVMYDRFRHKFGR